MVSYEYLCRIHNPIMRVALSSAQWALFFLTGGLVAPIVVAAAFHLSDAETAQLIQRTFLIMGLSSLLQVSFGHRLPILEGPAGIWWGVFILLSGGATSEGTLVPLLRQMEAGLLVVGLLLLLVSAFNVIHRIKSLFTPTVTGIYLLLLVFQFSSSIVKGMLGIGYRGSDLHPAVALLALFTLVVTFWLGRSKLRGLSDYAVFIGIVLGYVLFRLFGLIPSWTLSNLSLFSLPKVFAWGTPMADSGIILTSLIIALPLLINMIAAIVIMEQTLGTKTNPVYRSAGFVTGITQLLSGLFSAVGCISNSHSAGFVASTGMRSKLPFVIGCLILMSAGFLPIFAAALATVPVPVAFAVILYSFAPMLATGLKQFGSVLLDEKKLTLISVSLMFGVGSMFIPAVSLIHVPDVIKPILGNGLVVGVLLAIALEQIRERKDRYTSMRQKRRMMT